MNEDRVRIKKLMMNNVFKLFAFTSILFYFLAFSWGCANKVQTEGATFGEITVSVDASYQSIFESIEEVFEANYDRAKINIVYTIESEAINMLLTDTVRVAVVARGFSDSEKKNIADDRKTPQEVKIAYDAVAVIVNKKNKVVNLSEEQVKGILSGQFTKWNQISKSGSNLPISIIFESKTSGIAEYFNKKYSIELQKSNNIFGAKDNFDVIENVKNNPNAIAFVSSGWVRNTQDSTNTSFRTDVEVVSVAKEGTTEFVAPLQAFIHTQEYPYIRTVYMLHKETRAYLGTGFTNYVASEKGQRIFLKAGLLPATMPIRLVEVYSKPLNLTQ